MKASLFLGVAALMAGSLASPLSADPVAVVGERVFPLIMSGHEFNGFAFPNTPLLEAYAGENLEFVLTVPGTAEPHVFHLHGHPWYDATSGRFIDAKLMMPGDVDQFNVTAGGPDGFTGDWMYHCHVDSHFALGMWGILRVYPLPSGTSQAPPLVLEAGADAPAGWEHDGPWRMQLPAAS